VCNNETFRYDLCCLPYTENRNAEIYLGNIIVLLKNQRHAIFVAKCIFLGMGKVLLRMKKIL
jgi:hypothetical protein